MRKRRVIGERERCYAQRRGGSTLRELERETLMEVGLSESCTFKGIGVRLGVGSK